MELKPRAYEKIKRLLEKGVHMPNPLTIDIGDEVNGDQISGAGVALYPGCRIYGAATVIASGVQLGKEGPVTVNNCQLGPGVELKGGFFTTSVFLDKANMSFGAHVRDGCILEEEANGAHCVGLKQTILFPFVTLGSLINLCDCLMAGGTSRKNHSEVGSSYIHFNFTPDGNKTTASLFGDVPRGVMLNQPAIFLGGQGGSVGPVSVGYGTVVAAGSILRDDIPEDGRMVIAPSHPGTVKKFIPRAYKKLDRVVAANIIYLANLVALEQWYRHVRRLFFEQQEFGSLLYAGAVEKLALAKKERITRLKALVATIPDHHRLQRELHDNIDAVCDLFGTEAVDSGSANRDAFITALLNHCRQGTPGYIAAIQSLPTETARRGVAWLQQIIEDLCRSAGALLTSITIRTTNNSPLT